MEKICIIGSSGAGKSTLANKLGSKLTLDVHHLDAYFWQPGWIMCSLSEQIAIQNQLVKNDRWIIDGNYGDTLDLRIKASDTIIFLDIPRLTCLYHVLKRVIRYNNKTRPDMGKDCPEKLDPPFLKWTWNFKKNQRPRILKELSNLSDNQKVITLHSIKEINNFVNSL